MAKLLKFTSGLTVCYEKRNSALSCALGVYVGAGSRDELKEENGVAHFIEHMLFKGTEKRTAFDIANEFEKLGANANAYTSKTNTVYYVSGMAKFLDNYADLLSDMLFNSTFTEENIEKERGVVIEEIKMYDDDGESVCSDLLAEKFYGKNTLARPILGTEKSVLSLNADKIRAFMKRNYVAKNIALSYAGPASEKELREIVEKYFEKNFLEKGLTEYAKPVRKKVKTHAVYATRYDKPFEQANVIIRFPAYSATDKMSDVSATMAFILGGGMSSRLFQKVREELGLVYEIYCVGSSIKGSGYVDVGFATAPDLAEKAMTAIKEVFDTVKKDGINAEEFRKVMTQRETTAVLGSETTFNVMRLMGRNYLLTGKLTTYAKLVKEIEKITLEQVNQAFNEVIDCKKATVSYVGKEIKKNLLQILTDGE